MRLCHNLLCFPTSCFRRGLPLVLLNLSSVPFIWYDTDDSIFQRIFVVNGGFLDGSLQNITECKNQWCSDYIVLFYEIGARFVI